jgi:dephospho-CoA kinase
MPKIIGLTGGIGSGKSTIAKHLEQMGIPVYIADLEAKKILDSEAVISKIIDVFGKDILENKKIDRKKLSNIVFQQPEKLQILNDIIHPEVAIHFKNWIAENQDASIVVKEAAILFESGSYKDCDKIILVTAPKEVRIQRVMKRDKLSRESIESRMANQWSEEKKEALSDFIIVNKNLFDALKSAENIVSLLRNR